MFKEIDPKQRQLTTTVTLVLIAGALLLSYILSFALRNNTGFNKFSGSVYQLILMFCLLAVLGFGLFQSSHIGFKPGWNLLFYIALVSYFVYMVIKYIRQKKE